MINMKVGIDSLAVTQGTRNALQVKLVLVTESFSGKRALSTRYFCTLQFFEWWGLGRRRSAPLTGNQMFVPVVDAMADFTDVVRSQLSGHQTVI